jgi:pyruvate formate lyase activating enzyme
METPRGTIFDIQHYSIHDGPGIRTTVFLKGCPLSCLWCSNPESQRGCPEIMFDASRCTHCGRCVEVCPPNASVQHENEIRISRELCLGCALCVAQCPNEARQLVGRTPGVEEVLQEVVKDRLFYENSGGGVTLSGGEPMSQPDFTGALLKRCKEKGIHTVLDTSGYVEVELWNRVLGYVDMILFDLKQMDTRKHKAYTGVSNELILASARKLASQKIPLVIRIPLIPGYNDTDQNSEECARFARELGITTVELLPFHRLCSNKYTKLQKAWKLSEVVPPSQERLEELQGIFTAQGLNCTF